MVRLPRRLPVLVTHSGRFVLSPFAAADVDPLARLLTHDAVWSQGYGDGGPRPATYGQLIEFIHRRYDALAVFAIHRHRMPGSPLLAGTTGITGVSDGRVRVGRTVIDPALWGTGANHEAKVAVFDWLFAAGADGIECDVDPRNVRSLKSLTTLGFAVEGFRRIPSPATDSGWRDMAVLVLPAESWPEARARAVRTIDAGRRTLGAPA